MYGYITFCAGSSWNWTVSTQSTFCTAFTRPAQEARGPTFLLGARKAPQGSQTIRESPWHRVNWCWAIIATGTMPFTLVLSRKLWHGSQWEMGRGPWDGCQALLWPFRTAVASVAIGGSHLVKKGKGWRCGAPVRTECSGRSVSPFEVSGSLVDRGCSLQQTAWHQHLQSYEGAHFVRCYWHHSWSMHVQTRWRQSNHSIWDVLAESKSVKMDVCARPVVVKIVFPLFWLNVIPCWVFCSLEVVAWAVLATTVFVWWHCFHWPSINPLTMQFCVKCECLVYLLLLKATAFFTHRSSSTWFLCSNSTRPCLVDQEELSEDHVASKCIPHRFQRKRVRIVRVLYMPSADSIWDVSGFVPVA